MGSHRLFWPEIVFLAERLFFCWVISQQNYFLLAFAPIFVLIFWLILKGRLDRLQTSAQSSLPLDLRNQYTRLQSDTALRLFSQTIRVSTKTLPISQWDLGPQRLNTIHRAVSEIYSDTVSIKY